MKKTIALLMGLFAVFTLVSCSSPEQRVEKYVEENRLISGIADYVYCDTDIEANGTNVVFKYRFKDLDEHTDETVDMINEFKMLFDDEFHSFYEKIKSEESAVTALEITFCESDGDVIVSYVYE